MIRNQGVSGEIRDKLIKLYGDSSIKGLDRMISRWTSTGFGAEVLGVGFNYERQIKPADTTWIEAIHTLEQIISEYAGTAKYYIIFDELDEDYREFPTKQEAEKYRCMLTSLFKAVQNVRAVFDDQQQYIYPIVFLRSDIYAQLMDSDKNKWEESIINMEWDTSKIQNMLAHRLCVAQDIDDVDFDTAWKSIFSNQMVRMGNRQAKKMSIFSYIERSTEMRPRDFIQYVKECVRLANINQEWPISPQTVKDADDNFSEYLKGETIDELFPVLPEITDILGLLSTIRKQRFGFDSFDAEYKALVEQKNIPERDVKLVLFKLFDAGVIGNQPSMRGQTIFRFSKKSPRFNYNESMIVHRGLYKALQIF